MNFLPEQIEILWIIPVIALIIFIFIIQLVAQKREHTGLSREVAQFNTGILPFISASPLQNTDRLNQLERAISTITDSLTVQQKTMHEFSKGTADHSSEINDLKARLRELYKEYDIVLSENYSLRAKVKKMQDTKPSGSGSMERAVPENEPTMISSSRVDLLLSSKVDMKLYEDTRTLNIALLDDTSEIDLNDLTRHPNQ